MYNKNFSEDLLPVLSLTWYSLFSEPSRNYKLIIIDVSDVSVVGQIRQIWKRFAMSSCLQLLNYKQTFEVKFVAISIMYLHIKHHTSNSNGLFPPDWKLNMQFLQPPCCFTRMFYIKTALKNCTYFWNVCYLANAQICRRRDRRTERLNAAFYALIKYGM